MDVGSVGINYSFHADAHEALRLVANGIAPIVLRRGAELTDRERRDAHAAIRALMDVNKKGRDQGGPVISPDAHALAHEVRQLRNDFFHGVDLDLEGQLRLLGSCWRLLDELDAVESTQARALVDRWLSGRLSTTGHRANAWPPPPPALTAGQSDPISEPEPLATDGEEGGADAVTWSEGKEADNGEVDPIAEQEIDEVYEQVPLSVGEIIARLYEYPVRVHGRMREPVWVYQGESDVECPKCGNRLDVCREGAYQAPPDARPWAVVCTACGTARRKREFAPDIRRALWRWGQIHPTPLDTVDDEQTEPVEEDEAFDDLDDDQVIVVCPACDRRNRSWLGANAVCGICDTPLPVR